MLSLLAGNGRCYCGLMGAVDILLVDEDHRSLVDLAGLLEEAGFIASTATHAYEALQSVATRAIGAIVTEVSLSGMSGFELMIALRSAHPDVPVIVMSAHPTPEGRAIALELGAIAYVSKPVSVLLFLDALTRALAPARPSCN